jgi:hypothetical protein
VRLSSEVIASLSGAEEGRREVQCSIQAAFALLILGSAPDQRLLEVLSDTGAEGGELSVPEEDVSDFVAFCCNYLKATSCPI